MFSWPIKRSRIPSGAQNFPCRGTRSRGSRTEIASTDPAGSRTRGLLARLRPPPLLLPLLPWPPLEGTGRPQEHFSARQRSAFSRAASSNLMLSEGHGGNSTAYLAAGAAALGCSSSPSVLAQGLSTRRNVSWAFQPRTRSRHKLPPNVPTC